MAMDTVRVEPGDCADHQHGTELAQRVGEAEHDARRDAAQQRQMTRRNIPAVHAERPRGFDRRRSTAANAEQNGCTANGRLRAGSDQEAGKVNGSSAP